MSSRSSSTSPVKRVELDDAIDLVSPELYAHAHSLLVGGQKLQCVSADSELAATEVEVVTLILHIHQLADELAAIPGLPLAHVGYEALVLLRRSQSEDARDRGDYQHIAPCQTGPG